MVISTVHPVSPAGPRDSLPEVSTVAIIPARYLSTRLPGKPLVDIAGRPMIEHVYRRAAAAPSIEAVVVATDDPRVRTAVEGFGGLVRLTSATHRSGTDRLAEVAAELRCELVVNVQGDEPLVEPTMLEQALAPFGADPELMMTTLRCRINDPTDLLDPNVVKVVTDRDGYALYFSRSPLPFSRGGTAHPASGVAYKHIGLYVYRRAFLLACARLEPTPLEKAEALEQLRVLEHGFRIKTIETSHDPIGVDTPEDLERVRCIAAATARV